MLIVKPCARRGRAGMRMIGVFAFAFAAPVALSNMYPDARSVGRRLRDGWPVAVAYVFGFFIMLAILGWKPDATHKERVDLSAIHVTMGDAQ